MNTGPILKLMAGERDGGRRLSGITCVRAPRLLRPSGAFFRLAFGALLVIPASAQAAELVSNIGQDNSSTIVLATNEMAMGFETGPTPGGYTLGSIEVEFVTASNVALQSVTATLWTADEDDSDIPGSSIATLSNPASLSEEGVGTFSAPPNTTLSASTDYFVHLSYSGNIQIFVQRTRSDDEDDTSADGWSIHGDRLWRARGSNNAWVTSGHLLKIRVNDDTAPPPAQTQTEVPADWSLIPSGLSAGDDFRLLIVTSTQQTAENTDIVHYNTVVQGDVSGNGHTDIQGYSAKFNMLGCTETTSASANTNTASTDTAAPIYWLNGAKVADDYADLYDGSWDSNAPKYPAGTNAPTIGLASVAFTGCGDTGVVRALGYLGSTDADVNVGYPGNAGFEFSNVSFPRTDSYRFYGLSEIFRVAGASASTDATLSALSLGTGVTLDPAFASATTEYRAWVANPVDSVTVTATKNDEAATVAIAGDDDDATRGTAALSLDTGRNTVKVTVTAEDGNTTEAYTVTLVREAAAPSAHPAALLTASMTVGERDGFPGYNALLSPTIGAITGADFEVDSTRYELGLLGEFGATAPTPYDAETVVACFVASATPPDAVRNALVLLISGKTFRFDASTAITTSDCYAWPRPAGGLGWSYGEIVAVALELDVTPPALSLVAVSSMPTAMEDTYGVGETIRFTVTFNGPVRVTGAPHFEFSLGPSGSDVDKEAALESGDGTTALVFAYTVLAADMDDNGIWVRDHTRTVKLDAGETIRDLVSNTADAVLTHIGLGLLGGHKVDGSLTPPPPPPPPAEVPANWGLIPSGLSEGDAFRLLIVTSTRQDAEDTAIADYNSVVQGDVSSDGHADIRSYSAGFNVLGCTETTSAIANTYTGSTDTAAAIYWLNGAKVADNYADLYDGNWDSNRPKYPGGTNAPVSGTESRVFTGCLESGASSGSNYLGADRVNQGYPASAGFEIDALPTAKTDLRRFFGLSGIFRVGAAAPTVSSVAVTSTPTAESDTYGVGELIRFTVTFTDEVEVSASRPHFEFSLDGTDTRAAYERGSGTTALVFVYTVLAADMDDNGIWIGNQTRTIKLDDGEYIRAVDDQVSAFLNHAGPGRQSEHKVDGSLTPTGHSNAIGAPAISGTARVGETLTAAIGNIADADGLPVNFPGDYSFQWIREDSDGSNAVDIPGATLSTYALVAADEGKKIKVRVSFQDDDGNDEELTSAAYPASKAVASLSVQGIHSATMEAGAPTPGAVGYSSGGAGSLNPSSFTYDGTGYTIIYLAVLGDGELSLEFDKEPPSGWTLHVDDAAFAFDDASRLRGNRDLRWANSGLTWSDGDTVNVRLTTLPAMPTNTPATGAPAVSGFAQVGKTLTAAKDTIADVDGLPDTFPDDYTLQWVRVDADGDSNSVDIGTDSSTYMLVAADEGKKIKVRVSFQDNEGNDEALTGAAYPSGMETVAEACEVLWCATLTVGNLSTLYGYSDLPPVDIGSLSPDSFTRGTAVVGVPYVAYNSGTGGQLSLQIRRISGTTPADGLLGSEELALTLGSETFTFTAGLGSQLVFAFDAAGLSWNEGDRVKVSLAVAAANNPATGVPAISGTARVGETLTAARGSIEDTDGLPATFPDDYTLQWVRVDADGTNPVNIGTDLYTYALVAADVGKKIKVEVSFQDDDGNDEEVTSEPYPSGTATVAAANNPATGAPAISGTARAGETLTAAKDTIADADGLPATFPDDYTLQWVRVDADGESNSVDIGTDSSTYMLVAADEGKKIKVRVSFQDNEGNDEALTGAAYPSGMETVAEACEVLWCATLTVGNLSTLYGYSDLPPVDIGSLSPDSFTRGTAVVGVPYVAYNSGTGGQLSLQIRRISGTTPADGLLGSEELALTLGSETFTFTAGLGSQLVFAFDAAGLSWNEGDRVKVSLAVAAANNPATGVPAISGTARVGETLTAARGSIEDTDGLPATFPDDYTLQWVRVDADGTNPVNIGTDLYTYALVAADVGKKIKVEVSFQDKGGADEEVTSAAYPASGTVGVANNPATGAPAISGTARAGETLTAAKDTIADADGLPATFPDDYTLQWVRVDADGTNPVNIGTDSGTYALVAADVGKKIKVEVSFQDDDGNDEEVTSEPYPSGTATVAAANNPATGAPAISGTARAGETLTAAKDTIADADGLPATFPDDYTLQWVRVDADGTNPVNIGTDSGTYALVAADVGKKIKVEVSFQDDDGNDEEVTSEPYPSGTATVAAANNPATGVPAISGTARVGETLTAAKDNIADADGLPATFPDDYTLQWVRVDADGTNPVNIGTDSGTYALVAADVGKKIKVEVSFQDDDGNDEEVTSEPYPSGTATVGVANNPATGAPAISGTARAGETLTAAKDTIADADGLPATFPDDYTLQWVRVDADGTNPVNIGTDLYTYALVAADVGKKIKVEVSFQDDDGNDEEVTSEPYPSGTATVGVANNPATGAPAISGTARAGETLTAAKDNIADADGLPATFPDDYTLQWVRVDADGTNPVNIGTDLYTYALVAADMGKKIKVEVSFQDDDGNDEEVTSEPYPSGTATVAAANNPATGAPAISGTARAGETLTAAKDNIADADGLPATFPDDYTLQWVRVDADGTNPVNIGTDLYTYALVAADVGKKIKVEVSFQDDDGNDEEVTSEPYPSGTATVAAANNPATGAPAISGTARAGETLTAAKDTIADADGLPATFPDDYTLQWVRVDADGTNPVNIGTDLYTYALVAADVGKKIKVEVSFQDDDGNDEEVTSEPYPSGTATVAAANNPATGAPAISGTARAGETLTAAKDNIADADGLPATFPDDYTLQWVRVDADGTNPVNIGTDSGTYALVAADVGKKIKVEVSFQDDDGNDEEVTSEPYPSGTATVAAANNPATGAPAISGTARAGETLTAAKDTIADADGLPATFPDDYTLQWVRVDADGTNPVNIGTDSSTYMLVAADEGKKIKVRVSFQDNEGNDEALTGAAYPSGMETVAEACEVLWCATLTVGNLSTLYGYSDLPPVDIGSLSPDSFTRGTAVVGVPYVAYNSGTGGQLSLQIRRISGTTPADGLLGSEELALTLGSETFTFTAGLGSQLVFAFDAAGLSWNEGDRVKVSLAVAAANNPATGVPAISGTARVGETLTAAIGNIADIDELPDTFPDDYTFQWVRVNADDTNPVNIGTDLYTYALVAADVGKKIKVEVSFQDKGGADEEVTSAAYPASGTVGVANNPATGAPAISGTARVGETLTAAIGNIADIDELPDTFPDDYTFQWVRVNADDTNPVNIGTDLYTYALVAADVGKKIKVEVSFQDKGGADEEVTSAAYPASGTVGVANNPATGAPAISGTARAGETLTAAIGNIADTDMLPDTFPDDYTFQWVRVNADGTNPVNIGTDLYTYALVAADVGKKIKVEVSFQDKGGADEEVTSEPYPSGTATVGVANNPATGAPVISGTARAGETLTAAIGNIADTDGLPDTFPDDYTFQWVRVNADDTNPVNIGTDLYTYALVAADVGKKIKVEVSFQDKGGADEEVTSAAYPASGTVGVANNPATGAPVISGTARVGETLTAAIGNIADIDELPDTFPDDYTFQWVRVNADDTNPVNIGTDLYTYALVAADVGKKIKVEVSFQDKGGADEEVTSAAYPASGDGWRGQQPRHRGAGDIRDGAGRRDADGGERHHRRRRRAAGHLPGRLHLPVGPGECGRYEPGEHRDRLVHLRAGGGRRGQEDQGGGELPGQGRRRRGSDQRAIPVGHRNGWRGQQPRHRGAGDIRHGAGRRDADRGDRQHRRHRRAAGHLPGRLHLPVGPGECGRYEPGEHRDRLVYLRAGGGRRGQEDQGGGELPGQGRRRRGSDQCRLSRERDGWRGQQPRHRGAGDIRHGAGRGDADRGDRQHRRHRRAAGHLPGRLHLPVGPGECGRYEPGEHRDRLVYLRAGGGRRGQEDQGAGQLPG